MTHLPWVRLDSNIGQHDKILELLADPSPRRWQAVASYVFALAWAGGVGTDGRIPPTALPIVHGTANTARLLVKYGLWEETPPRGWRIRNYGSRQQLTQAGDARKEAQRRSAARTNCIRYHGPNCGCWRREEGAA